MTYYPEDGISVEYDYTAPDGDGWNEPRTPESVDIYSVIVGGVEMIDYIAPRILELWAETILESLGTDEDPPAREREWECNYER